ncbi:MAG: pantoate--beta-alanine ligase [Bernardetiaceae bacterium]|nr:pantoate--beta-alanine ligase [Bernardetiaceae bacterium]
MQVFEQENELKEFLKKARQEGQSIGFVPTMGALHEGHLSLVRAAKSENDLVVCSIFVNPIQFTNAEDLEKYPNLLTEDKQKLKQEACDVLFCPTKEQVYKEKPIINFHFEGLDQVMEGRMRPGHFSGVAVVVSKLFNIVQPNKAYFGQKDLQQFAIIARLIKDLSFDITLRMQPIVREEDGLAMSSRNMRLSDTEREIAPKIYEALVLAEKYWNQGASLNEIKTQVALYLQKYRIIKLEYFEIVHADYLTDVEENLRHKPIAFCIAAQVGNIRLLDNIII